MQKASFKERLAQYWKEAQTAQVPFKILRVQELADGVIAVLDSMGEYDVYFDPEYWEYIYPKIWNKPESTSSTKKYKFEVLPGVGHAPLIRTFEMAIEFAQDHLKPKETTARWHSPIPGPRKAL